jgi:D-serine deaminase-like pyridoxal phosphate-dependent protein
MTSTNSTSADYFHQLSRALVQAEVHQPVLIVDKQRLDTNLDHLLSVIQMGFDYRIVAKSLPSIPLLNYIMEKSGSNRLMSFHLPFLFHVVKHLPHADILLGKPMTVAAARQFYQWHQTLDGSAFNPAKQLHWLVDSLERLQQYQALAKKLNCCLNINLEIDVGLHRGGFNADSQDRSTELKQALELLKADKRLILTGLMGYDAHVSKIPKFIGGSKKAFRCAMKSYQACLQCVIDIFGQDFCDGLILNAGGSSTYPLYKKSTSQLNSQSNFINEIATASALVKPTDFDVHTLEHHKPACFIATPILKLVNKPEIPMLKGLSKFLHTVGFLPKQACFIYGGNWLATPCFPESSKRSNIFGISSNQEMYTLPTDSQIKMDEYLFFRPTQSEAVFLQFGKIAVYDEGSIIDWWSVFHSESISPSQESNKVEKYNNEEVS